ncbi:MAG: RHS repeat protein, partial [Planctomycetota bacterium]
PSYMEFAYAAAKGRITRIHARREDTDTNDIYWDYKYSGGKLTQVIDPVQASGDPANRYALSIGVKVDVDINTGQASYERIITDRRGYDWTWRFDSAGLLTATIDPKGKTRQYAYDADRNVTSFTNERGYTWTATYGAVGNLLTLTSPIAGQTWTYSWQQVGGAGSNFWRVTQFTDPAGKWVRYEYADPNDPNDPDDATKIVRVIEMPATTGGAAAVTKLKYYDASVANYSGQLSWVIDANGSQTLMEYNKWGYLETIEAGLVDPNAVTRYVVPLPTRQTGTTDDLGRMTGGSNDAGSGSVVLDANGNVIATSCLLHSGNMLPLTNDPIYDPNQSPPTTD